ncbi:cytochrome c oxidase assembly protein [Marinobacter maroccanus]|uniref:Cytochrome c oxidase assembly protein n=1 Tax=Marinobacter maroccanus TaxID=2055143 RepID=A0A2S5ZAI9_9GAMM|nr:SCO family protein [Marinobacter maroccanus]PPI84419.1 cytochrome c oxidase assembly protein [Marinobacter maroccanus]
MNRTLPLWPVLVALMLAGCTGKNESWHGKDISGLMPELEFQLQGTNGQPVTAADSKGNIRLLYFGFTSCPDVCPTTLTDLRRSVHQLPEQYRDDFTTLFVSVDPRRDTPERLASYVNFFGDRVVGLTAEEPALRELAKRYRTTFGYDEPDASGNYNVSHSSAVYVFDRDGNARLLLRPGLSPEQISEDLTQLAQGSRS